MTALDVHMFRLFIGACFTLALSVLLVLIIGFVAEFGVGAVIALVVFFSVSYLVGSLLIPR